MAQLLPAPAVGQPVAGVLLRVPQALIRDITGAGLGGNRGLCPREVRQREQQGGDTYDAEVQMECSVHACSYNCNSIHRRVLRASVKSRKPGHIPATQTIR